MLDTQDTIEKSRELAAPRMLTFTGHGQADDYAARGFVHVQSGVDPTFLAFARQQAKALMDAEDDLSEWAFSGKKLQYLFEFPADNGWFDEFLDVVAEVTRVPRDRLTLCERHIKAYVGKAPEQPPPHKDRAASEITVGIPLTVPEGSLIDLYPEHHLEINPFTTTALWRESLDEEDLPERVLAGIDPVRLDVQPGDILMFRGSQIYHERYKPANAVVLYLKLNGRRLDPIGEDPSTGVQRERSLALLEAGDDEVRRCRVDVSPRLDRVTRLYSRLDWTEVLQAQIWDGKPFGLTESDLRAIRNAGDGGSVQTLVDECYRTDEDGLRRIRRLVRLQALDLIDP